MVPAGGLPFSSPAYPAFGLLSCPLSPRPALAERSSPVGKGETISLFRRGLRPRHPCIRPFATLTVPAVQVPSGVAQEGRSPADLAIPAPAGGLARLVACLPCLYLLFCPHPPTPLPSGKGETISLFRRGLRPRHPCIKPFAALTVPAAQVPSGVAQAGGRLPTLPFRHPQGGLPPAALARPAAVVPGGGLAFFVACLPCLYLLFCPLSPRPPSPPGKGENQSFLMQGALPLASPGLNLRGTGSPCQSGTRRGCAFGISNPAQNRKNRFPMSSAGSQGEGGPGEMELSVASDGGV